MVRDCFIVMPISTPTDQVDSYGGDKDHFAHVLEYLFLPAIEMAGLKPVPPRARAAHLIHAWFTRALCRAALVLVDLSCLNPNVLFELGIRTALDLPLCLTCDEHTDRTPFDVTVWNCHRYRSTLGPWEIENQVASLAEHVRLSASEADGGNAYWRTFGANRWYARDSTRPWTLAVPYLPGHKVPSRNSKRGRPPKRGEPPRPR